ncbi:UNVERIFIED_CONTAM: virulence RhuM family protein [Streptococcus canis]|uniref:Virulence protein n=2 Tax=Streptococcus canis TaxID=1329 RepID=A0A3P5Y6B9_STRCB|nr:RhuM family protein [Streptococcus canis]MDV5973877.1 virulence RhuM family protein [Streptococcus canis]QKG76789.1 virulence RhuM family protein [Streptococcus canis]VDC41595.1 hypothetical protein FMV2238Y02_00830 [Streptococcus canis]
MNELQFLIYTADNNQETASVIIRGETIWASQKEMSRLFDVGVPAISKHYAITGKTAAEIIYTKADHTQENMGLTTWKNSPDGRILQSGTQVAKNYLTADEIRSLERSVSSYFDYLERQIEKRKAQTMQQLAQSIDRFLTFQEYDTVRKNTLSHLLDNPLNELLLVFS